MTEEEAKAIEYSIKDLKKADMLKMEIHTDDITVRIDLNLIQKQQAEIEKKDRIIQEKNNIINKLDLEAQTYFDNSIKAYKIIDEMASFIKYVTELDEDICQKVDKTCFEINEQCKECIKQYFERKVEE